MRADGAPWEHPAYKILADGGGIELGVAWFDSKTYPPKQAAAA